MNRLLAASIPPHWIITVIMLSFVTTIVKLDLEELSSLDCLTLNDGNIGDLMILTLCLGKYVEVLIHSFAKLMY